jgi:hypothetical protein
VVGGEKGLSCPAGLCHAFTDNWNLEGPDGGNAARWPHVGANLAASGDVPRCQVCIGQGRHGNLKMGRQRGCSLPDEMLHAAGRRPGSLWPCIPRTGRSLETSLHHMPPAPTNNQPTPTSIPGATAVQVLVELPSSKLVRHTTKQRKSTSPSPLPQRPSPPRSAPRWALDALFRLAVVPCCWHGCSPPGRTSKSLGPRGPAMLRYPLTSASLHQYRHVPAAPLPDRP